MGTHGHTHTHTTHVRQLLQSLRRALQGRRPAGGLTWHDADPCALQAGVVQVCGHVVVSSLCTGGACCCRRRHDAGHDHHHGAPAWVDELRLLLLCLCASAWTGIDRIWDRRSRMCMWSDAGAASAWCMAPCSMMGWGATPPTPHSVTWCLLCPAGHHTATTYALPGLAGYTACLDLRRAAECGHPASCAGR